MEREGTIFKAEEEISEEEDGEGPRNNKSRTDVIEKKILRFALRNSKKAIEQTLGFKTRRRNNSILKDLTAYALRKLDLLGANEDLMLFVAEQGALLH